MTYENIDQHLRAIGLERKDQPSRARVGDEVWASIAAQVGAPIPGLLRWLFDRLDAFEFSESIFYLDPRYRADVMVGWFFDGDELPETFEDTRDALPVDILPISDDGGGNHLAVGLGEKNAERVYFHIHDSPLGEHLYLINDSLEQFLLSLHKEALPIVP